MQTQWELYKSLELIPDGISGLTDRGLPLFRFFRRSLADTQVRVLDVEYQIQHFERCFLMEKPQPSTKTQISEFLLTAPQTSRIDALIPDASGEAQPPNDYPQAGSWSWYL
jgi:hypothetical protein